MSLPADQPAYSTETYPVFLGRLGGSSLLVLNELKACEVDSRGSVSRQGIGLLRSGEGRALSSFDEITTYGNNLVAYGTYLFPGTNESIRGFISAKIDLSPISASQVKLILPLEQDQYYLLGHHYLTSNDLGVFFLAMDHEATLWQYSPDSDTPHMIDLVPKRFNNVPGFRTRLAGARDMAARYREIETQTIPVGIYGQGAFVYLLGRQPSAKGTVWTLDKLDPTVKRILGRLTLPTNAHHLTVVPSSTWWYFIERGEVGAYGDQETKTMLVVPSSWITAETTSPLGGAAVSDQICRRIRISPQGSIFEPVPAPPMQSQGSAPWREIGSFVRREEAQR